MDKVYKLPNYDFQTNIWLVYSHSYLNSNWRDNHNIKPEYYKLKNKYKKELKILRCGAIMLDKQNRILCVHGKKSNKWSIPKGHQRYPDEPLHICAMRELFEETNVSLNIPENNPKIAIADQRYFIIKVENLDDYVFQINDHVEVKAIKAIPMNELLTYNTNYGLKELLKKL